MLALQRVAIAFQHRIEARAIWRDRGQDMVRIGQSQSHVAVIVKAQGAIAASRDDFPALRFKGASGAGGSIAQSKDENAAHRCLP